jgi:hypothetical protein
MRGFRSTIRHIATGLPVVEFNGKGPRKNKFVFYGAGVLAAGEA